MQWVFCFCLNNILPLILTCPDIFRNRQKEGEKKRVVMRQGAVGINVSAFHLPFPSGAS